MSSYVCVKNKKGEYHHCLIPEDVMIYIRQLEAYIKHPKESKLLEAYSDRFQKNVDRKKVAKNTKRPARAHS